MNAPVNSYAGTVIAMGTMHGKERQVAPAFAAEIGARVIAPPGIDTDQFGTFAGEINRTLAPVAAASAKARIREGRGARRITVPSMWLADHTRRGRHPGVPRM
ncbi:hypothetical protein EUA02_22320 [Mycobacterium paragordonae]|nr:hypothetical protein [Mycobacterium paragordonae]TDK90892.1 hypothetical protein EUA02_22320 [Mycobacterium paragordonae]TDL03719.1 hypothetical protein EUA05_24010 [Mycobacterium paragordonae]